jgi:hypothetical protein
VLIFIVHAERVRECGAMIYRGERANLLHVSPGMQSGGGSREWRNEINVHGR